MFSKKISALIAVLLVSAFVLTGCKNKANTSSDSSSTDVNSKPTVSSDDSHTEAGCSRCEQQYIVCKQQAEK